MNFLLDARRSAGKLDTKMTHAFHAVLDMAVKKSVYARCGLHGGNRSGGQSYAAARLDLNQ